MNSIKLIFILLVMFAFMSCDVADFGVSNFDLEEGTSTDNPNGNESTYNPNCPYNNSGSSTDNSDEVTIEEPDGTTTYNEGMVAHYTMERGAIDYSIFENHGELEGNITNDNGEIQLDGQESRLVAPHQDHLNLQDEFTISAMINPNRRKTQILVRKGTTVNGIAKTPYSLGLSATGVVVFSVSNENGRDFFQARANGYSLNQWMQVTGVFKNQQMKLYVDGLLVAENEVEGNVNTNSEPLIVGTHLMGLESHNVDGSLDEIRMYDVALNDNDVKQLFLNLRKN